VESGHRLAILARVSGLASSGWSDREPLNVWVEQFITSIDDGAFNPLAVE
jgi:hypothetical protein